MSRICRYIKDRNPALKEPGRLELFTGERPFDRSVTPILIVFLTSKIFKLAAAARAVHAAAQVRYTRAIIQCLAKITYVDLSGACFFAVQQGAHIVWVAEADPRFGAVLPT